MLTWGLMVSRVSTLSGVSRTLHHAVGFLQGRSTQMGWWWGVGGGITIYMLISTEGSGMSTTRPKTNSSV